MPKISEIANASGFKNEKKIREYIQSSDKYKEKISKSFMSSDFNVEADLNELVSFVKAKIALEEAEQAEQAQAEAERIKAEQERNAEIAKVLVTSGYSFEGYRITKYSGYISGDDAISVDRGFDGWNSTGGNTGEYLLHALTLIRQNAIRELKEAAYDLGCNAIIGVDFDYIDLAPETANSTGGTTYYPYVFCVTANGTAVTIEKD